jgi:hypothetical protein
MEQGLTVEYVRNGLPDNDLHYSSAIGESPFELPIPGLEGYDLTKLQITHWKQRVIELLQEGWFTQATRDIEAGGVAIRLAWTIGNADFEAGGNKLARSLGFRGSL